MPRIILAHWHRGRPPGSEFDVDGDQLRQLVRDGRVAGLVEPAPAEPAPAPAPAPVAEPPQDQAAEPEPQPEPEAPAKSGRRRR